MANWTTINLDNADTPASAKRVNVTPSGLDDNPYVTVELTDNTGIIVSANLTPDEARSLSSAILAAIR